MLGVQALACVAIIAWTAIVSFLLLKLVDVTFGLRVSLDDEILGADLVEHGVNSSELPGEEAQQREYVQLMLRSARADSRGEGDGGRDSNGVPESPAALEMDPESLYRQIKLRDANRQTHVFGIRHRDDSTFSAVMEYLRRIKARRFSDEVVSKSAGGVSPSPLKRSSSLREFTSRQQTELTLENGHLDHISPFKSQLKMNQTNSIHSKSEVVETDEGPSSSHSVLIRMPTISHGHVYLGPACVDVDETLPSVVHTVSSSTRL